MTPEKGEFQQPSAEGLGFKGKSFEQVVASVRPTAIVGAAAKRGSFSKPVIEALVQVFLSQMLSPFCVFLSQMLPPHVPPLPFLIYSRNFCSICRGGWQKSCCSSERVGCVFNPENAGTATAARESAEMVVDHTYNAQQKLKGPYPPERLLGQFIWAVSRGTADWEQHRL